MDMLGHPGEILGHHTKILGHSGKFWATSGNFGPPREYFGPPRGDFWSHRGNFGPSLRGNFGPYREHFGPPQVDCDPSRYYGSVRDDAGHSEQLGPGPRQSGSQNHGDHGMVKTHLGPPGQGFSEPSGEQNGPPDTQNRP